MWTSVLPPLATVMLVLASVWIISVPAFSCLSVFSCSSILIRFGNNLECVLVSFRPVCRRRGAGSPVNVTATEESLPQRSPPWTLEGRRWEEWTACPVSWPLSFQLSWWVRNVAEYKENYILCTQSDGKDSVVAAWTEKNPEKTSTIKKNEELWFKT